MPEPPSPRADDAATPVFVTPRAEHDNSIVLAPHDPLWPEVFAAVRARKALS